MSISLYAEGWIHRSLRNACLWLSGFYSVSPPPHRFQFSATKLYYSKVFLARISSLAFVQLFQGEGCRLCNSPGLEVPPRSQHRYFQRGLHGEEYCERHLQVRQHLLLLLADVVSPHPNHNHVRNDRPVNNLVGFSPDRSVSERCHHCDITHWSGKGAVGARQFKLQTSAIWEPYREQLATACL